MKRFVYIFSFLRSIALAAAGAAVLGVWMPGAGAYVSEDWRSDSVMSVMDFQQIDAELGRQKTLVPGLESQWIICRNDPVNMIDPDGEVAITMTTIGLTTLTVATVAYLASPSPTDPSKSNAQALLDTAVDVFDWTSDMLGNLMSRETSSEETTTVERSKNITVTGKSRKKLKDSRKKPAPHKSKAKRKSKNKSHDHELTKQQKNKSGTGNKMKTDGGSQTPHFHDQNHNIPGATNVHYRLTGKVTPGK